MKEKETNGWGERERERDGDENKVKREEEEEEERKKRKGEQVEKMWQRRSYYKEGAIAFMAREREKVVFNVYC